MAFSAEVAHSTIGGKIVRFVWSCGFSDCCPITMLISFSSKSKVQAWRNFPWEGWPIWSSESRLHAHHQRWWFGKPGNEIANPSLVYWWCFMNQYYAHLRLQMPLTTLLKLISTFLHSIMYSILENMLLIVVGYEPRLSSNHVSHRCHGQLQLRKKILLKLFSV